MLDNTEVTTTIKLFKLSERKQIAFKWQVLEKSAEVSIFLSWHWIDPWLDLVTDKLYVVESVCDNRVVALGFFVETTRKVLGFYSVKQWWLHRTGDTKLDQIWIEHNDFLLNKHYEDEARKSIVNALLLYDSMIKEFVIGLSLPKVLNNFALGFSHSEKAIETIGYIAKNQSISSDYLQEVLSKNTRSQINRSKKLLKLQGGYCFKVITDKQGILDLLPKIVKMHVELWCDDVDGSGFSNDNFNQFHQAFIKKANNIEGKIDNVVQIAKLSVNNNDLGYLVNFVYNNKVYFYLSAISKCSENKIKIGLTLHSEAVQYYCQQGILSYDFLGGEAQYKRSLSNITYKLVLAYFYRDDTILKLERVLKKIKNILRKKIQRK